jgi:hydroxymethylpyrimidine pyrophosphatase-like HAD family hydrolase/translation initiation factor 2B subunit (eIF-2B alpha/beta/delta family)
LSDEKYEPVFISYASEDKAIADLVAGRLRRDGVEVWQYTESGESGGWHLAELRALRNSKVAIFVITEASAASSACLDEAQRVADPNQTETTPIPLAVGAWNHEASDLWLLLSKWNGVVASPDLTEDALHRLADLVHNRLGSRPASSLSTGQALSAVKDDLCALLGEGDQFSTSEILQKAAALQHKHRGNMVAFTQFSYLDRELRAADLLPPETRATYIRQYLQAFFDRIVTGGHADVARRLAAHIEADDTVVISEYSRVIRQAIKLISESDPRLFKSLRFLIVSRTGMLLMADEPSRMAEEIRTLGGEPEIIPFSSWIDFLVGNEDELRIGKVDKLLFGVEAFGSRGDIVYPQIVKELDVLRTRAALGSPIDQALVIASGEAFKVCRDDREVSKMIADPHYTVMPATAVDLIITDLGEFRPGGDGTVDLTRCVSHVITAVDEIRKALWPSESPLPVWNLPSDVRTSASVLATDIDGSVTNGSKLSLDALAHFVELERAGMKIILITGRSAAWAAALAHYLPGVFAAIAENGAVLIERGGADEPPILLDGWDAEAHKERMHSVDACFDEVRRRFPGILPSKDNFTRLTDRTLEVTPDVDAAAIADIAREFDVRFTYSTVHYHLSGSRLDKASGLLCAMQEFLPLADVSTPHAVVTLGDSFNDAPLFDDEKFAATVGVRGVLRHLDALGNLRPRYVTLGDASDGFVEFAGALLSR